MKIRSAFKSLAGRFEELFSKSDQGRPDLDLLEQLDRSWSGKARNGPLHYKPGVTSRDSSFRGYQHTRQPSEVLPTPRTHHRQRSISRVSSEPCIISSGAQTIGPRDSKQDSASSVHDNEAQVLSAPMDIYPSNYPQEPTAPVDVQQKNRLPSWNRRKQHAAATAAANKAASAKAAKAAAAKNGEDAHYTASNGSASRKPCLKQGGLSNALSREPSVHQGNQNQAALTNSRGPTPIRLSTGTNEFIDSSDAIGSWAMRKVTFSQNGRGDSAHFVTTSNKGANSNLMSDGAVMDPAALAAALASLEGAAAHEHVTTSLGSPGTIVGDTSLAMEWPVPTETILLNQPITTAAVTTTAATATVSSSDVFFGDLPGTTRSIISDPIASEKLETEPQRRARSLDSDAAVDAEEAAALALAAATGDGDGTAEWNARFLKRWRAVKQRARLQALGMRSIWKLNSPNGSGEGGRHHHHPPELLTNELPDGPPELPQTPLSNAASGSIKDDFSMSPGSLRAPLNTPSIPIGSGSGGRRPQTEAAAAAAAAAGGMNRDPSLATMLLGEVAEVC